MTVKKLIGSLPSQVSRNRDLGGLAFQNPKSVDIQGGSAVLKNATASNLYSDTNISDIRPSLLLDFAKAKELDPKISFSRNSVATYYDGETVALAENNLIPYSQDFSSQANWARAGISVSSNATIAPDGTPTASKIMEDASNAYHYIQVSHVKSSLNIPYTASIYAKACERSWLHITVFNGSTSYERRVFDITNGVIGVSKDTGPGTAFTNVKPFIQNAGNGWFRCGISFISDSGTNTLQVHYHIVSSDSVSAYQGSTTQSGIFVWGAQLEQRLQVTDYVPTSGVQVVKYQPVLMSASAHQPRFNHDPVTGSSRGLLLEDARTNLLTYSEQCDVAGWTKNWVSITANATTSPDGTLSADKVVETYAATYAYHNIQTPQATITAGSTLTGSIFVKSAERKVVWFEIGDPSFTARLYARFNLESQTILSHATYGGASMTAQSITDVGNGWYRISLTGSLGGSYTSAWLSLTTDDGGTNFHSGDGFSGVYIWGAQLEVGSYLTSYIKTETTSQTRYQEYAYILGENFNSWYRQDEGTLHVIGDSISQRSGAYPGYVSVSDSTGINGIGVFQSTTSGTTAEIFFANVQSAAFSAFPYTNNSLINSAITYKNNISSFTVNGATEEATGYTLNGTSVVVPIVSQMNIGMHKSTVNHIGAGHIKKIAYYPKRLSMSEIQEMTLQ